jgi:capsular exopolysaccharide synthesis family protein
VSHIFDGLQKSESERFGIDSFAPKDATELLRHIERRASSTWEAAVHGEPSFPMMESPRDTPFVRREGAMSATAVETPPASEFPASVEGEDIFDRFQPLQVSVVPQNRLVSVTENESPAAEAFRLLGVRLRDLRRKRPLRSVLITSTIPQEGKSMVSANLACTLSLRVPEKTLLVEGDLRRPSLSQIFGIGTVPGLSQWLAGKRSLADCIYYLEAAGTWILPAGTSPSNPLELLQSGKLPKLMDELTARFEWVIVDSPPVLPLADSSVWMRSVDGVLLVARRGTTEKRQLERGLEAIESKKLIGALLNSSMNPAHSSYYYYRKPAVPAAS